MRTQRGDISLTLIGYGIIILAIVAAVGAGVLYVEELRLTVVRQEGEIRTLKSNVALLEKANASLETANQRQSAATQAAADARKDAMDASRAAWAAVAKANAEKASMEARLKAVPTTGDECKDIAATIDAIRQGRAERGWP